jgi:putative nucleotidyltransferase with HDIG domain
MLKRIKPRNVLKGMYIHSFEGGWLSHPFWHTRFVVESDEDLAKVRSCSATSVVIDEEKGRKAGSILRLPAAGSPQPTPQSTVAMDRIMAKRVVDDSKEFVRQMFDGVALGKVIRSEEVLSVVDEISASLSHNSAMLIGVVRLKTIDQYTYLHSVAVCAMMVNFARELEMDAAAIRMMGLSGLLHDIGKMAIDPAILNKPGRLTEAEVTEMRHHPGRGRALLLAGEGVPDEALDVCLHHHEKMDGTGYPFGLKGEEISLAARMAAICDVYDAVTSVRAYKEPWTPHGAVLAMDNWHGHFDPDLLFQFMKSIGVFPVGTLLRLQSGRLAVVMDNGRRASRAKLKAFYVVADRALIEPRSVMLSETSSGDQVVAREDPASWGFTDWDVMRERLLAGKHALVQSH